MAQVMLPLAAPVAQQQLELATYKAHVGNYLTQGIIYDELPS